MVEHIQQVLTEYERRLWRTSFALRLSFGRPMLAEDGDPKAMFFTGLFCDEPMALEFLQDMGLLQTYMRRGVRGQGVPPFVQFLHLVTNTDWSLCDVPRCSDHAT